MDQPKFDDWISQARSLSQDQRVLALSRLASQRESTHLTSEVSSEGAEANMRPFKRQNKPFRHLIAWNSRFSYIVFMSFLTGVFLTVAMDSWSKGLIAALVLPLLGLALLWVNGMFGGLSTSELAVFLFKHRDSYLSNQKHS
ncbi:MAG: hypothetical protein OXG25_11710 [Gammaproteobacteria bacterium]|nr:hypothetical protein [Gammaproteobacteria bacterium]